MWWRIRRANLPERWSLDTFPGARQTGVNRKQIRTFAELDFVARHENIVLTGRTGVGKTGLACGLLLKALQNGYAVSLSARRIWSMRCTRRWPIALHAV